MTNYVLPFEQQQKVFLEIILKNKVIKNVLDQGFVMGYQNWYLVAGCLNQTLWNYLTGRNITANIKDYDLIYFDPDLSAKKEEKVKKAVEKKYEHLGVEFDVVNQARVHTWIQKDMGFSMPPLHSTEEAIASWPNTVACVGIRKIKKNFIITAPFGLTDNLQMTLRPNKTGVMLKKHYNYKVKKWTKIWPELKVIPW